MKKKIINVFLMALISLVAVGTVVSCKDYEEDNYSELNGKFTNLKELTSNLEGRIVILEKAKEELEGDIAALKQELGTSNDDPDRNGTIYARIIYLQTIVDQIQTSINNINSTLNGHSDSIKTMWECLYGSVGEGEAILGLVERVSNNEEAIKALQKLISVSESDTVNWNGAVRDAKEALKKAEINANAIDSLGTLLGDDFSKFKDAFLGSLTDGKGNWTSLSEYLSTQLAGYTDIEDFNDALDRLNKNEEALNKFRDSINAVTANLELQTTELYNKFGFLESIINQYVSGVIIQGTNNPVYGTFSLPFGISSNVLAAYYGNMKNGDVAFPVTDQDSRYVGKYVYSKDGTGKTLTEKDLEMLALAGSIGKVEVLAKDHNYLVSDQEGNAGTLYMTINPVGEDHTGAVPTLENSAGTQSKVSLSPLKPSDDLLTFGYTRGVENGFYASKATVYESDIDEVKPRVSYEDIKSIYTDAKNIVSDLISNKSTSGIDLKPLVTNLYSVCSNVLDANAVKFSWTASYTDENGNVTEDKTRSVMSKYELAATAIRPLSYNTWINANYDRLPGIGHVENIIGKLFDKVRDAIPQFDIDDVNITIDKIVINPVKPGEVSTTVKVDMSDVIGADGKPVPDKEITVDLTEAINEVLVGTDGDGGVQGDLNSFVEDLNEQIDQINDLIAQLKQINDLGQSVTDIENSIYDYLHRGEDIVLKFINNANKLLQPVMLVKTSDSFLIPSSALSAPTRVNAATAAAGISIYPTSYTAEILAPAFRKLVGVTNVYDKNGHNAQTNDDAAGNCKRILKTVNSTSEGLAKVQYGDWNRAKIMNAERGYVYEIVYTAVDYSGRIVAKKYYIELD